MLARHVRRACATAAIALTIAAMLGHPVSVLGNLANRSTPGEVAGEPTGDVRDIAITHETLSFDLRPLPSRRRAIVTATYRVRNDGQPVDVALVFVSPGLGNGRVTVDGSVVPSTPTDAVSGPASWRPPTRVPRIGGGEAPFEARGASGYGFRAHLEGGEHELGVTYEVLAGEYHGNEPYHDFQVGYVLSPARSWKSFGRLDLSVDVPPGWEVATSLPLERQGDRLSSTFTGIPADAFSLTTRPAAPAESPLGTVLLVVGPLSLAIAGFAVGRRLAPPGIRSRVAAFAFAILGVGLAIAVLPLAASLARPGLDTSFVSRTWTYSRQWSDAGSGLIVMIAAAAIGSAAVIVGARSRRTQR